MPVCIAKCRVGVLFQTDYRADCSSVEANTHHRNNTEQEQSTLTTRPQRRPKWLVCSVLVYQISGIYFPCCIFPEFAKIQKRMDNIFFRTQVENLAEIICYWSAYLCIFQCNIFIQIIPHV